MSKQLYSDVKGPNPAEIARIEREARARHAEYVADSARRAVRALAEPLRRLLRIPFEQRHA